MNKIKENTYFWFSLAFFLSVWSSCFQESIFDNLLGNQHRNNHKSCDEEHTTNQFLIIIYILFNWDLDHTIFSFAFLSRQPFVVSQYWQIQYYKIS